ncbi:mitochondrial inner membrane protein OXA1L [Eurytemora carolleeae]|uniref:mitochondrial inner membrane protein OXA1L n=1 Tax=Eurytemora carolleeae TaxID=1294199 RepID=UPI000C7749E7|nr:mitochondrial inner membrane protein OXA1L [Eurytemora carolleeae]|eukprot:XP_023332319.1 mitochondrial inner membrane protein OXA1L-like [Eurytemora affinis]
MFRLMKSSSTGFKQIILSHTSDARVGLRLLSISAARLQSGETQSLSSSETYTQLSEQTNNTINNTREELPDSFKSVFENEETNIISNLAEPSFLELGLGHNYPSGMVQTLMEFLHIDIGLPWWQVIGATTLTLRFLLFPVVVVAQRNMVTLNNHQPQIQKLQIQQQMASLRGETDNAVFAAKCLGNYMSVHNCHPGKAMLPLVFQAGCFMTMFFGLRGMTNVPVPSLLTGGFLWFHDLSMADPTYILPLITTSTIYLQLYLGADGLNTSTMPDLMKKMIYILPLISIPVMIQFPAALNLYWFSNNVISVIQAQIIRHPQIRLQLGIGEMIKWKPEDLPMKNYQEEIQREMQIQKKKRDKLEATKKREKEERLERELRKREELLAALEAEDNKMKETERTKDNRTK